MVILPEFLVGADQHFYPWQLPFMVQPAQRPYVTSSARPEVLKIAQRFLDHAGRNDAEARAWQRILFYELMLVIRTHWTAPAHVEQTKHLQPFARIQPAVSIVFNNKKFIRVEDAARACSMSRNTFALLFKQVMGLPFAIFALRYRLNATAWQIRSSDLPLKAIATEWGFTDISHLHRYFLRFYGVSPGEYRCRATGNRHFLPDDNPSRVRASPLFPLA